MFIAYDLAARQSVWGLEILNPNRPTSVMEMAGLAKQSNFVKTLGALM